MGKKVLVAEDSSVIQNLTKRILSFQNYEIISLKNGKEVIDYLDKNSADIILLDINMPIMNGIDCAKAVRALADTSKAAIPIIAITGNAQNHTLDFFHSIGINEFLPKPLNFDLLVEMVNKYTQA
jgi:two-component system cell cycle response regulator DivK